MSGEVITISPMLELYNSSIARLTPFEKKVFFLHDFRKLLLDQLVTASLLNLDTSSVVDILKADDGEGIVDNIELREKLVSAIEEISVQTQYLIDHPDEIQGDEFSKSRLSLVSTQLGLFRKLAPILLTSFDYFSTLDPDTLEELKHHEIDVRDICNFFEAQCNASDDYEGHNQVNGLRAVILFNLLRNARRAEDYYNEFDYDITPTLSLVVGNNEFEVKNPSKEPITEYRQKAMHEARVESLSFGLFITSYYVTVGGDQLKLEQIPIDTDDEDLGYNITFTLKIHQN